MRTFLLQLATFFGVGKIPKGPGTWGTLATVPIVYLLSLAGPLIYMTAVILFMPLAVIAAEVYTREFNVKDDPKIVVDEVLGFLITMTWMPLTWQTYLAGFVLFRFLDILKPPPIKYFDKRVPGGLGVVMDDVVAGIVANIFLQILYTQTPWLGVQNITFSMLQI
jgi:phosphatidylglycerophosphatase A